MRPALCKALLVLAASRSDHTAPAARSPYRHRHRTRYQAALSFLSYPCLFLKQEKTNLSRTPCGRGTEKRTRTGPPNPRARPRVRPSLPLYCAVEVICFPTIKPKISRTSRASSSRSAHVPPARPVPSPMPSSSPASRRRSAPGSSRATASLATSARWRISCPDRACLWTGKTRRRLRQLPAPAIPTALRREKGIEEVGYRRDRVLAHIMARRAALFCLARLRPPAHYLLDPSP